MKLQLMIAGLIAAVAVGCVQSARGPEVVTPSAPPTPVTADIPEMLAMPDPPRENIRRTCRERWPIADLDLKTFRIRPDLDEFVVQCNGTFDGDLYRFVIRTGKNGHWINDGRTKIAPQRTYSDDVLKAAPEE